MLSNVDCYVDNAPCGQSVFNIQTNGQLFCCPDKASRFQVTTRSSVTVPGVFNGEASYKFQACSIDCSAKCNSNAKFKHNICLLFTKV